jgi:hypothetical protein
MTPAIPLVASGVQVREMQGGRGGRSGATEDEDNEADRVPGRRAAEHGLVSDLLGPGSDAYGASFVGRGP